ncbi:MAG TPA: hypothetical protein VFM65_10535 [Flavobacteriaceae bacterium]|nr:hypothetical protein [Flavobacteriaceae bacterium]
MKNTIKILLITICLSPLQSICAQEQQEKEKTERSDATWAETRDFINKYKKYIKEVDDYMKYRIHYVTHDFSDPDITDFSIGKSFWISVAAKSYGRNYGGGEGYRADFEASFNLYYLDEATLDGNAIRLRTTGDNIKQKYKIYRVANYDDTYKFSEGDPRSWLDLRVPDDEMRPRLLKAFQHLAYLANKKRAEDRAASGEKF